MLSKACRASNAIKKQDRIRVVGTLMAAVNICYPDLSKRV